MPRSRSYGNYIYIYIFYGSAILFTIVAVPIHMHTNIARWFPFLHSLSKLLFIEFLMIAIQTGVKRYLIVDLIFISLIISDVELLFLCLLVIVCLLWRNVYLDLPIF